jgi:hypothetical protein
MGAELYRTLWLEYLATETNPVPWKFDKSVRQGTAETADQRIKREAKMLTARMHR